MGAVMSDAPKRISVDWDGLEPAHTGIEYHLADLSADLSADLVRAALNAAADRAEHFASNYQEGTDGRNTFIILRDDFLSRAADPEAIAAIVASVMEKQT